jgi:hypothetical protein
LGGCGGDAIDDTFDVGLELVCQRRHRLLALGLQLRLHR